MKTIAGKFDSKLIADLGAHNVPKALLRDFNFKLYDIIDNIEIKRKESTKLITIDKQIKTIKTLTTTSFSKNFIVCFNAENDFMPARQIAVRVFWHAIQQAKFNRVKNFGQLPIWYYIAAGFSNVLLEKEEQNLAVPLLLVLDGLDTQMSATRIDKTRDVLNLHSNRPILLLLSGKNGAEFCSDRLHVKLNAMVRFAHRSREVSI